MRTKRLAGKTVIFPIIKGVCNELAHARLGSDRSVKAAFVQEGDRVYVYSTYLNAPKRRNAWSHSLFD